MENIRQVLLLRHDAGLSYRMIGAALGVSRGTISNILMAASAAGISWPLPADADDTWLREVLFPRPSGPAPSKWLRLDVEGAVSALSPPEGRRSPRITRWLVRARYCAEAAEAGLAAYSYGHFCKALAPKATEGTGRLEMRFPHAPGDWMFSDFSGKSVPVLGPGGAWYPEIIVVVLAYSNLLYVEALEAQSGKHWTMAQRRALEYFGGCSRCLGIDNLKAGVTRNRGEDILLNPSFREFFAALFDCGAAGAGSETGGQGESRSRGGGGEHAHTGAVAGSTVLLGGGTECGDRAASGEAERFANAALRQEPEGVVRGTGARRAAGASGGALCLRDMAQAFAEQRLPRTAGLQLLFGALPL